MTTTFNKNIYIGYGLDDTGETPSYSLYTTIQECLQGIVGDCECGCACDNPPLCTLLCEVEGCRANSLIIKEIIRDLMVYNQFDSNDGLIYVREIVKIDDNDADEIDDGVI